MEWGWGGSVRREGEGGGLGAVAVWRRGKVRLLCAWARKGWDRIVSMADAVRFDLLAVDGESRGQKVG